MALFLLKKFVIEMEVKNMFRNKNKFFFSSASIFMFGLLFLITIIPTQAAEVTQSAQYVKDIAMAIIPWFNIACVLAIAITVAQLTISKDQKVVNGAYKYITVVIATFFVFNMLGSIFLFIDNSVISTSYDYNLNQSGKLALLMTSII